MSFNPRDLLSYVPPKKGLKLTPLTTTGPYHFLVPQTGESGKWVQHGLSVPGIPPASVVVGTYLIANGTRSGQQWWGGYYPKGSPPNTQIFFMVESITQDTNGVTVWIQYQCNDQDANVFFYLYY